MAEYRSKYTGAEVDALLDKVESGEVGGKVTVDSVLSTESENPVMNKVITAELSDLSAKVDEEVESLHTLLGNHDTLIEGLQENKADVSGYYPQLHVGLSDNLPDRGDVTEGLIGFRESAGAGNSIEDGTANVQELLGNSVVWNQLCIRGTVRNGTSNGISYSVNANGVFSLNGQTSDNYAFILSEYVVNYIAGHKYILLGKETDVVKLQIFLQQGNATTSILGNGIFTCNNTMTASGMPRYRVNPNSSVENFEGIPSLIDLTQMFGVGNEPSTIEEFYARIPMGIEDENAYNEGEVIGVNIKGIKSVNDNAFNGKYAKVLGGREYCADGSITNIGFAKEIGGTTETIVLDGENKFTPSENGYVYASGTDICIHLVHTGYKDHIYTEHEESESSFDLTPYFPDGMHGINGVRDSVTKSKAVRRFGMVKMKDLRWTFQESNARVYASLSDAIKIDTWSNHIICNIYPTQIWDSTKDFFISLGSNRLVFIKDSTITSAEAFVASLTDDDIIIYELATPIETEIDPQLNMNYKVWDFGTEELLTDSKSAPVLARTIYGFNATDTIRGNKEKIKNNEERIRELESEAVRGDDYQPNLSVGLADNLAGVDVVDSEINFRRSGGGAISDGVARIEAIKGNSVVWNQLRDVANKSSTATKANITLELTQGSNIIKLSGIYDGTAGDLNFYITTAFPSIAGVVGHKYLCTIRGNKNIQMSVFGAVNPTIIVTSHSIVTCSTEGTINLVPRIMPLLAEGTEINEEVSFYCTDLTQMFGVGNEPTTIEEFYARIPMGVDLNAYNEGEVIHMDVQSVESVGVNQWDEEWESGNYNVNTGEPVTSSYVRSKSDKPIKVLPNTEYYIHNGSAIGQTDIGYSSVIFFYDTDDNFIKRTSSIANKTFTTPQNCDHIRFYNNTEYGTTYKNDICINLSDTSINGKYFPYIKRVEDLSIIRKYFPNGMKSAGSAHDEIRYNKATQKWEYSKGKIKTLRLADLVWYYSSTNGYFYSKDIDNLKSIGTNKINILCDVIVSCDWSNFVANYGGNKATMIAPYTAAGTTKSRVNILNAAYTDVSAFIAWLEEANATLYYESNDWEWVELDAEDQFKDLDYQVWNCGTEKAIAEGISAPLAADITYGFNAIGKIKELESLVAALRAKVGI